MNEEEADKAHDVYLAISKKLTKLVNDEIKKAKLNAEQEEYVRDVLTETSRFWKDYE